MKLKSKILVWITLCLHLRFYEASRQSDVLLKISLKFGRVIRDCQNTMLFDESVIQAYLQYWQKDAAPTDQRVGCVLSCFANKLELLDNDGKVIEPNFRAFVKANGADMAMTEKLLDITRGCFKPSKTPCVAEFHQAICFRSAIFELNWAPPEGAITANQAKVSLYS